MSWTCRQCTLINEQSVLVCSACSLARPQTQGLLNNLLPKAFEKPLNNIACAISEIFSPPPRMHYPVQPTYNIDGMESTSLRTTGHESPKKVPPRRPPPPTTSRQNGARLASPLSRPDGYDSLNTTLNDSVDASQSKHSRRVDEIEKDDEASAAETFKNIQTMCQQLKTSFIDPDFPHSEKSLGRFVFDGDVVNPGPLSALKGKLVWLRPSELYTKDGRKWTWAVFRDPSPSDIEQGMLGDCWLMSALALVAERPDVLEHIVLTKVYNPMGAYQLRLCLDGEWRIVTVDDTFPCNPQSRSLVFAVGRKNQLWPSLIEKALAKLLGSYGRLRAGRTVEGLSMLTGASCETIRLEDGDDADLLWARLLSAKEAGFIMGSSCGAGSKPVNEQEFREKGLLSRHAYSILDMRMEGAVRLLRLRNPWGGTFVWKGAYSDKWPGWPVELRRRLIEQTEKHSGAFWIRFNSLSKLYERGSFSCLSIICGIGLHEKLIFPDFLKYFDAVDIAKVRPHGEWSELRVAVQFGGPFEQEDRAMRVIVEEPTECCFNLYQAGARLDIDKVDLMLCVHRISPTGLVDDLVIRSSRSVEPFITTGEVFLQPGHYVVVAHSLSSMAQTASTKRKGHLVVHSNHPIYGELVPCPPQMYTDSLVNMILKEGKIHAAIDGCTPRYVAKNFGGLIVMMDNYHEKMYMQMQLDCSESENMLCSRGSLRIADCVPPLHRKIIVILSHFEPSQGYRAHHKMIVRSSRRPTLAEWSPLDPNALEFPPADNWHIAQLHHIKPLFT